MAHFVDRVLAYPQGQIVLCNVLDGLDQGLYDGHFVRQVLDWWRALFLERVKTVHKGRISPRWEQEELMTSLDFCVSSNAPDFRPGMLKPDFLSACVRKANMNVKSNEFVNVTSASSFIRHLLDERARRKLVGTGRVGVTSAARGKAVANFMSRGKHTVLLRVGATVGRPGRVLWLTPVKNIEADLVNGAADRVRDRLGLINYNDLGVALLALRLPGTVIASTVNGRPTFADAGSNARFKTRADTTANRRRSAWGHTADLDKFARSMRVIDGLPERISRPLISDDVRTLPVAPLGRISVVRGTTSGSDDHDTFAKRLSTRHGGVNVIRTRMLAIL
ncbi:MAG: hypothetical protein L0387_17115 [Acidobacteria bacterium]|nr:hypothetical protein [Acidobacteriota bacterium]MCI0724089.1 hypothetical protein [Acidobacteriota bacterium]